MKSMRDLLRFDSRLLVVVAVTVLSACDSKGRSETPEGRLETVGDALESAEENLESLTQKIEYQERVLVDLRKRRRQLRERKLTLEERVAARATDIALFRAVQSALLEERELAELAIAVDVDDGVVRLSGQARSVAEAELAHRTATAIPGVNRVESAIDTQADTDGAE